ncbi:MAG: flavin reductase family protein [Sphingobacteriia bacterium]|nr:flavin reductase family protein [Sphingobacteriia bacterium]
MIINIQELAIPKRQAWLQHAIAPRPIAFASTINREGNINLSPFSFFNLFSTNPPIIIFSPSRSGRDNHLKHTLLNVLEVPEVVVNICDYTMVQQVSLSSCEYPRNVDEFIKAGFTKEAASIIKPPMVKEAKIKMECKVNEVKSLGDQPGAGQLIIAEVLCMHVDESVLNEDGSMIDQQKIEHVARLGGDYYAVINKANLFTVAKPNKELGIGIDALPESIRCSAILTGNNLGQLANVQQLPEVDVAFTNDTLKNIVQYFSVNPVEMEKELHRYAKQLLDEGNVNAAWQVLLAGENV